MLVAGCSMLIRVWKRNGFSTPHPKLAKTSTITFFEYAHRNLGVLHIDLAKEVHEGKALDNLSLPALWYGVVVRLNLEFERSIRDIFFP
jgi:hypothetical protein